MDNRTEAFLHVMTGRINHSGRSLFDHLMGTWALLEKRDVPEYVCLAGAFHSIYGTNIFNHQTLSVTQRSLVVEMIGEQAERLAYIFCTCDRPKTLVDAVKRGPPYQVKDYRSGETIPLSGEDMHDLLLIEVANLEEQGGGRALPLVRKALDIVMSSILLDT